MELFKEFESGIRLPTAGGIMIVGELKLCISDEAALKALMECKGASGTLPCMMCSNVVSRNAELSIPIPLSRCMESSCTQTRQFSQSWTTLIPWGAKPLADEETIRRTWTQSGIQLCSNWRRGGYHDKQKGQLAMSKLRMTVWAFERPEAYSDTDQKAHQEASAMWTLEM